MFWKNANFENRFHWLLIVALRIFCLAFFPSYKYAALHFPNQDEIWIYSFPLNLCVNATPIFCTSEQNNYLEKKKKKYKWWLLDNEYALIEKKSP